MLASHGDGGVKAVFSLVGVVVLGIWVLIYKAREAKREEERLTMVSSKYTGATASLIAQKMFWHGQTAEQLKDSLGLPDAVDVKLLKTRRREVWKYGHYEANRYRTRVTLDNGIVTTWTTHLVSQGRFLVTFMAWQNQPFSVSPVNGV